MEHLSEKSIKLTRFHVPVTMADNVFFDGDTISDPYRNYLTFGRI